MYKIAAITFGYTTKADADSSPVEWRQHYRQKLPNVGVMPEWLLKYEPQQPVTRGDLFSLISKILMTQDGVR